MYIMMVYTLRILNRQSDCYIVTCIILNVDTRQFDYH